MGPVLSTIYYSAGYARLLVRHWDARDPEAIDTTLEDVRHAAILVPGFLGTRGALSVLRQRFARAGITTFTLNTGLRSLLPRSSLLRLLFRKILRVKKRCPRLGRLDLVGHSWGGIVANEAVEMGYLDG
ncbi:hypothetical protein EPN90_01540 [Patescibacteria group bacterium]|nr:MAG: hypothetical protein EPN90_01540 [Patescibacteria group bacterium]